VSFLISNREQWFLNKKRWPARPCAE